MLIAFLLTPYIVNTLGNTYYGIWALVVSMTGYYGLLDLGLSASLTQYASRYYATGDSVRLNETLSTGFALLAALAAVLAAASVVLALLADRFFEIPSEAARDVRFAVLIVGCGTALQFLFFPYSAIFPATQRFDISNAIGIGTRLLFGASVYIALERGYGLIGVSIATTFSTLADYVIRLLVARRLVPGLRVSLRLASTAHIHELAHFAVWNVVIAGSVRLISYTDAVVIAALMPPAAITPFVLATNLNDYFMRIFVPIGQVFFPAFTERDALGDDAGMRTLFLNGTRLLAVLALPAGLITYFFSESFFSLWIGQAATSSQYPSAASLFNVLVVASVVTATQRVSYQVFLGSRRVKIMAICFIVEAITNLVVSVALARPFGLMGVAMGTVMPALLIEGLVLPYVICRAYSIPFPKYLLNVHCRAILLTAILLPILYATTTLIPPHSWGALILGGVVVSVLLGALIVGLGLSAAERQRFVWNPVVGACRRFR